LQEKIAQVRHKLAESVSEEVKVEGKKSISQKVR
jgi:hypothetical protein